MDIPSGLIAAFTVHGRLTYSELLSDSATTITCPTCGAQSPLIVSGVTGQSCRLHCPSLHPVPLPPGTDPVHLLESVITAAEMDG
jgi:hypothetical protein